MPLKWIHNRIERFYKPFTVPFDDAEFYSMLHDLGSHHYVCVVGDMVMKTNIGDDEMDNMIEELVEEASSMDDMFVLNRVYDMHRRGEITIRSTNALAAQAKSAEYAPKFIGKQQTNLFQERSSLSH